MTAPSRRLGGDPDDLRHLAAVFDRSARTLADAAARIDRAVGRSGWQGPAARRFSSSWSRDRAALRAMAARAGAAASDLRRHADEQHTASRLDAHATSTAGLPRSESVLRVSGFVDVGPVEGRSTLVARVEELGGARSRVTVTDAFGLAGVAAAGATVELGCGTATANPVRPFRAEADESVGVEVEHRTVWEVRDDDVHALLAAEGTQRAAAAVGMGPLASVLAHQVEPHPAGQEVLVRAAVSAGAVSPRLGAVGPGARAQATATVAVGLATSNQTAPTLVVEATDDAMAAFRPGFLAAVGVPPYESGTSVWTRLELPARQDGTPGRPFRLEVRSTSPSGRVDRVVVHGRLSDDAAVHAAADRATRDLAAGRPPSRTALDTLLAGLHGGVVDPVVQLDQLQAVASGCSGRAVGGAGVRFGGGAAVGVVNLRPAPR